MQIQIGVSILQVFLGVVVRKVIPKMGNCDFGGFDVFPKWEMKFLSSPGEGFAIQI
jgi:hypothetical protein